MRRDIHCTAAIPTARRPRTSDAPTSQTISSSDGHEIPGCEAIDAAGAGAGDTDDAAGDTDDAAREGVRISGAGGVTPIAAGVAGDGRDGGAGTTLGAGISAVSVTI
jgi:hypothetical protein